MFRHLDASAPFPVKTTEEGTTNADVTGLRVESTDPFTHATHRHRNLLQWFNSTSSNIYCGIYARSYNTEGTGIDSTAGRDKVGFVFMTRDAATYAARMYLAHDGKVTIGASPASSTAALYVDGDVSCTGSVSLSIDAARVTGTFAAAHVPPLDASKVTSGTFALARIPSLAPSKFGSGELTATQMPNVPATQFTSGTLAASLIPDFNVSQVGITPLPDARIPSLSAGKITSGSFGSMFSTVDIPSLMLLPGTWRVGELDPFDAIALNTWGDSSGGKVNVVALDKESIGMNILQGDQGSSSGSLGIATFLASASGDVKVKCTSTSVNAFQVTVAGPTGDTWPHFRVRGSSYWGDGITTYNSANAYTSGSLYATIENVMLFNPHIPSNFGGTAGIRFGRAGGVASGTWWEIGVPTDGSFHISREANTTNRVRIDVSGNMTVNGDVTAFSDARMKRNVETIEGGLEKVCAMRGVLFRRKGEDGKKRMGLIAQEVAPILPEVVHDSGDHLSVAYGNIVGVLIEAVKEGVREREEIEALLSRLEAFEE